MASDVDICNLSLSLLGDSATVTSINPPDTSPQAEHCARFYSMSLATIQEEHYWSFCTFRATLAQLSTNPSSTWAYAYAVPSGAVNIISILDPNATDDYSSAVLTSSDVYGMYTNIQRGAYTPQPFSMESNPADGSEMILTNQANAVCRYTKYITDTSKFSPLFVQALVRLLASNLAGPLLKGEAGMKAAAAQLQAYQFWLNKARDSDASQRVVKPAQQVPWMNVR